MPSASPKRRGALSEGACPVFLQDHLAQLKEDAEFLAGALQQAREVATTAAGLCVDARATSEARVAALQVCIDPPSYSKV